MKQITPSNVALWLWERDGKPDGRELGEINKTHYLQWADDVLEAISTLGFKVVPLMSRRLTQKELVEKLREIADTIEKHSGPSV